MQYFYLAIDQQGRRFELHILVKQSVVDFDYLNKTWKNTLTQSIISLPYTIHLFRNIINQPTTIIFFSTGRDI
jgi:hypothetical protein